MHAIGVDVGGTKIAAGVISPEGEILSEVRYPTANVRETLLSTIADAIAEIKGAYEVGGVCIAVPGFILARENKVLRLPTSRPSSAYPSRRNWVVARNYR